MADEEYRDEDDMIDEAPEEDAEVDDLPEDPDDEIPEEGAEGLDDDYADEGLDDEPLDDEPVDDFEDEPVDDLEEEPLDDEPVDDIDQTPWGAQVLKRLHEDASVLLSEYDRMLPPLENVKIKKILSGKLEAMAKELSDWEGVYGSEYPDMEGLLADKDMDADEEGDFEEAPDDGPDEYEEMPEEEVQDDMDADSDYNSEDQPTEEEVVEGMEQDVDEVQAEAAENDDYDDTVDEDGDLDDESKGYYSIPSKKRLSLLRKRYEGKCGEGCDCGTTPCSCDENRPHQATVGKVATKTTTLDEDDLGQLEEVSKYFKGLAEGTLEYDEEARMKSYHYAKLMGKIGLKLGGGDSTEGSGDVPEMDLEKKGCGYSEIDESKKFLHVLTEKKVISSPHRRAARQFAKHLESFTAAIKPPEKASQRVTTDSLAEQNRLQEAKLNQFDQVLDRLLES